MAGSLPTFSYIRQRYQYLRGETDYTTVNATNDSHINAAVQDALNMFDFSYDNAVTTGVLSAGVFNLAVDYNPRRHLIDARIVGASINDDQIFMEIPVQDRDKYDTNSYVYWITYNPSTNLYVFNSNTLTGTITYYYHTLPTLMVASSDAVAQTVYCVIPDAEAIAYLAVAKNWIGDERNQSLAADFEQKAHARLQSLYNEDVAFGPVYTEGTIIGSNPQLNGGSSVDGLRIARP